MAYRILGVAPYEALRTTMERIAEGREDIELDCYVGDLVEGVEIVREHEMDRYDAIVSRGGTAREIQVATKLPVIDIRLSVYDILRSIRLADNYQEPYAIVGFENITGPAHLLCDLLQYRIRIMTIHSEDEARRSLEALHEDGVSMVICDMVTQNEARRLDMNAILVTSGAESIIEAYDQAILICGGYRTLQEENRFLRGILESGGSETVVMSERGDVFLSTWEGDEPEAVYEILRSQIQTILAAGDRKFFRTLDRTLYSVTSRTSYYNDQSFITFYFTATRTPMTAGKNGIYFYNKEEVDDRYFNSFFSIAGAMGNLTERIEEIAATDYPVLIVSEEGTGKELLAGRIYSLSDRSHEPFISIDCGMLTEKNWDFLLNHNNSPFQENGNTIYFQHLERIRPEHLQQLLSTAVDTRMHKRNRLIFSCVNSAPSDIANIVEEINTKLGCVDLSLPPLGERKGEIPPMANLYLSRMNLELGKQLIGFEPQAMERLESYDWPLNYSQFKRVLMEAATMTDSSYVRTDTVAEILTHEQSAGLYQLMFGASEAQRARSNLPEMTLQEMNEAIIHRVLEENGGNQSKTARQLGISRTTLWRYIKQ